MNDLYYMPLDIIFYIYLYIDEWILVSSMIFWFEDSMPVTKFYSI